MKTRRLVAALVPLLLLLWTFPARADVIWEPMNDFYAAHANSCDYVHDRYIAQEDAKGVVSPEDDRVLCTFPAGMELYISFVYMDEEGTSWGIYEEGEESCWVRLDALQKVYDGDDFLIEEAEAITPYADELSGFAPEGIVYLWTYPRSGEISDKIEAADLTDADSPPYSACYVDAQGDTWAYIPYLYGRSGWICSADPGNPDLPAEPRTLAASDAPVLQTDATPLATAKRTRLLLAGGAVLLVAAGSAVLLLVLARRRK